MVDAVSSTASATSSQLSAGISRLADNEETFLALLTTQLKNQDPLSPMDSNAFTQQITQMTGVEQQLLTNKLLQSLVDKGSNDITSAVNFIGKNVKSGSSNAALKNGEATWTYNLAGVGKEVAIKVTDAEGNVVYRGAESNMAKGDHVFTWNGKDQQGKPMADGTYTISVEAVDSAGEKVTVSNFTQGTVTAVEMQDGEAILTVNGNKIPLSSVTSVAAPTN